MAKQIVANGKILIKNIVDRKGGIVVDPITFEDRGQFVYCRYTGPFAIDPLVDSAKVVTVITFNELTKRILYGGNDYVRMSEMWSRGE